MCVCYGKASQSLSQPTTHLPQASSSARACVLRKRKPESVVACERSVGHTCSLVQKRLVFVLGGSTPNTLSSHVLPTPNTLSSPPVCPAQRPVKQLAFVKQLASAGATSVWNEGRQSRHCARHTGTNLSICQLACLSICQQTAILEAILEWWVVVYTCTETALRTLYKQRF